GTKSKRRLQHAATRAATVPKPILLRLYTEALEESEETVHMFFVSLCLCGCAHTGSCVRSAAGVCKVVGSCRSDRVLGVDGDRRVALSHDDTAQRRLRPRAHDVRGAQSR